MRSHYVFNSNQKGVTHVTLTTTIYRNKFRFCENKFQPYTIKCLLFSIYCCASGSAPAVLVEVVWCNHGWVMRL